MSDDEGFSTTPLEKSFAASPFTRSPPPSERSLLLNLVSRVKWSAATPTEEAVPLVTPVTNVVLHWTGDHGCTAKEECTRLVWLLQRKHMGEQGHKDIQYNYIVGGDGFIYEGLGWTKASRMLLELPLVLKGSTVVVGLMGTKWKDSSKLMQSSLSSLFTVATIEGLLKENMELFDFSNGILSKPSDKPENVDSSFPPT